MTVAIYQQTQNGMLRLGTFKPRKYYSVRAITEQFLKKNPSIKGPLFMSRRVRLFGKWVDNAERIPMDAQRD